MNPPTSSLDRQLCQALCLHPGLHGDRYTEAAKNSLLEGLFRSLTNDRADYLHELFPNGFPTSYKLQDAQGVQENAEYTAAAKGHPCGHIFKAGEASYHCSTCTDDSTAVLCSRCFVSSDHEGHQYTIGFSAGNSGCCDCGDNEAWKRPVKCAIHTAGDDWTTTDEHVSPLPADLQESIRTTVSRVLDYFCDIISCSPENLRMPKTVDTVTQDEARSRLNSEHYIIGDDIETNQEFCLIIWNDEKHTVREVQSQVARACRERESWGLARAEEANDIGRSVIRWSRDLKALTGMAKIIEEIKITVTIRSARDTFREQMCGTIIDWLADIAGCSILGDSHVLRRVICEEMLQIWRIGSEAWNAKIGRDDLDDHGNEEEREFLRKARLHFVDPIQFAMQRAVGQEADDDGLSDNDNENDLGDVEDDDDRDEDDLNDVEADREMNDLILRATVFGDADPDHPDVTDDAEEMDTDGDNDGDGDGDGDFLDVTERMDMDGATPPPPPHQGTIDPGDVVQLGEGASPTGPDSNANYLNVPRTPAATVRPTNPQSAPPNHWKFSVPGTSNTALPVYEDLAKNIRVDSMILFDLRLWKLARTNMRDLFISTLVHIPQFKRLLGLRFSGLYTTLAQLYLVADREPDHSIINLSLQLLTTPSITEEVIERGNFLTNLMAILYTFLTTRQVGFPKDLDPGATLGFDAGSVANRRLYHFFSDLRYFLASPFVQEKARSEPHYLFQFLDLAKLSQGICPNVRAIGDHVEYETDAWISASLLTRDINKLCRQFAEAYYVSKDGSPMAFRATCEAISHAAGIAIINSLGLERRRFDQAEIKELVKFHLLGPFGDQGGVEEMSFPAHYRVVDFIVEKGPLSFHHPLHYTLSWLLEGGKYSKNSIAALRDAAQKVLSHIHEIPPTSRNAPLKVAVTSIDDALLAMFDFPLRVCAWLAQMRANLWVRNGMSLRHQMVQYKSVAHRDVGHHRDLFLLQSALVTCMPGRVLLTIMDRFGLTDWMQNDFVTLDICEDSQMLDLAEDFTYLLINLLSDRDALISDRNNPETQILAVRKDIAHTLCFKPLSYSDLSARLTERAADHEELHEVLEQMTRYRPPEGLHDSGLFELKEEYLQELDPYNSHFSKNQRDEAENIYKKWMAKKLNKSPDDIVLEPKLHSIPCEAYSNLCAVVHTTIFADVVHKALLYVASGHKTKTGVSATRVEAFLQIVLQLILIATLEDNSAEHENGGASSFVSNAIAEPLLPYGKSDRTILTLLHKIWSMEEFSACRSKIRHVLRLFNQKQPRLLNNLTQHLDFPSGRFDTASPANVEIEIEAKKKQAMERKARVMAQFQQQQQNFMDKQGVLDWGDDDLESPDEELPKSTETRHWKYPSGLCIQCREDTSDSRLYGTFAMVSDAHILRQTDTSDNDFVGELFAIPENLDRSIEHIRPFGVSGSNHHQAKRLTTNGEEVTVDFQGLGKGWPKDATMKGPVSTSCGHIMHFTCFENYYQSIARRHSQQVARNHPERIALKEFVCPLCKALSNTFLPIVWKHSQQSYPGALGVSQEFDLFLDNNVSRLSVGLSDQESNFDVLASQMYSQTLDTFSNSSLTPAIALWQAGELSINPTSAAWAERPELAAFTELTSIYGRLRESLSIVSRASQPLAPKKELRLNHFHMLINTLANTIASVEIGHRGREAEYGTPLLTSVPQQTLSHLQTLSSTLRAYAATGALTVRGPVEAQLKDLCELTERQLTGNVTGLESHSDSPERPMPLLRKDAFQFLVQATMVLCPIRKLELRHILQLCLTLELLRVVSAFMLNSEAFLNACDDLLQQKIRHATPLSTEANELRSVESIIRWLDGDGHLQRIGTGEGSPAQQLRDTMQRMSGNECGALFRLCKAYALVFLRKSAVFFHVAHGIDFPNTAGSEASLPELDRLLHFFQLPKLPELLMSFDEFSPHAAMKSLAGRWVEDSLNYEVYNPTTERPLPLGIGLLHPAPLELIGLPKYFDTLMDEAHRRKCPTTGKEVSDPALCLFCGEIFCSQTVCCLTNEMRGGCNAHLEKCSSPIGMFLFIRKCHVALLHVAKDPKMLDHDRERTARGNPALPPGYLTLSHGSFFSAPYLTKYGETDSGLRSKHQLILNQKRYDKLLRDTWLMTNGSVWSTIARKLESEVNAGGWETL